MSIPSYVMQNHLGIPVLNCWEEKRLPSPNIEHRCELGSVIHGIFPRSPFYMHVEAQRRKVVHPVKRGRWCLVFYSASRPRRMVDVNVIVGLPFSPFSYLLDKTTPTPVMFFFFHKPHQPVVIKETASYPHLGHGHAWTPKSTLQSLEVQALPLRWPQLRPQRQTVKQDCLELCCANSTCFAFVILHNITDRRIRLHLMRRSFVFGLSFICFSFDGVSLLVPCTVGYRQFNTIHIHIPRVVLNYLIKKFTPYSEICKDNPSEISASWWHNSAEKCQCFSSPSQQHTHAHSKFSLRVFASLFEDRWHWGIGFEWFPSHNENGYQIRLLNSNSE